MNRISRSLTTVYRTEGLIARRRFAVVQNQIILMAFAGAVALIGLILLNVALFFMLQERMSPAAAAGTLALVNIVFAGFLAGVATKLNVESEIASAVEVRNLAIADLEFEVEGATQEVRDIVNSLQGLRQDPFGSLSALILPLLTALLKKND